MFENLKDNINYQNNNYSFCLNYQKSIIDIEKNNLIKNTFLLYFNYIRKICRNHFNISNRNF